MLMHIHHHKKVLLERSHEGVINGCFEQIVNQKLSYGNRIKEKHKNLLPVKKKK